MHILTRDPELYVSGSVSVLGITSKTLINITPDGIDVITEGDLGGLDC